MSRKKNILSDDVDMDLVIDREYINAELMDQPLLFKKWASMAAEANKNVKIVDNKLSRVKAKLTLLFSKEGLKVKEVESKVLMSEEVEEIENDLIDAEQLAEDLKHIVQAFRQRHENLKELSTNIRKELED